MQHPAGLPQDLAALDRTLVMGVVNVTPDSFSDGGAHNSLIEAVKHANLMINAGATIIDIGGESTRPGAAEVSVEEELARVIPVVERLSEGTGSMHPASSSRPWTCPGCPRGATISLARF